MLSALNAPDSHDGTWIGRWRTKRRRRRLSGPTLDDPKLGMSNLRPHALDASIDWHFRSGPMRSARVVHRCAISVARFPAWIAGLLHAQKNEWCVVAFARHGKVAFFVLNEGGESRVACVVSWNHVASEARLQRCDVVLLMHNHPRADGLRASQAVMPSTADHREAERLARLLLPSRTALVSMICVDGVAYEYFYRTAPDEPFQLSLESLSDFEIAPPQPTPRPRRADGRFVTSRSPWAKSSVWPVCPTKR